MNSDVNIIWRRGDGEMPEKVKHVVKAAQDEILFRTLQLPFNISDTIRYYASKNDQTVNEYISDVVVGHVKSL